jgi:hypothetical protein
MSALPTNVVPYQPPSSLGPLLPNSIGEAIQVAELMAKARMVPDHLRGSVADCFLVVNQARLWRMDPFSLAQGTSFIHGKMMYEGKVIAAVVHSLGNLSERLSYEYSGKGDDRTVTVSGTLRGESKPRTVDVKFRDAKTNNKVWNSQPDQQLAYHGARVWARRHVPEVIQGVYAAEEFPEPTMRDITPPKVEPPPPPKVPKPAIKVKVPGGWDPVQFSQDDGLEPALRQAMEFMVGAIIDGGPTIVSMNNKLLDRIAEVVPDMADEVSELRAAAAEAMTPKEEPEEKPDTFVERFVNGDDPEPDDFPGTVPPKPNP